MKANKLIIATAGSGKTTFLVRDALKITDSNVLITTFTDSNKEEIIKKILSIKKYIPKNIFVQTWFSFLLQHGVRPYQSVIHEYLDRRKIGFFLNQGKSAPYVAEKQIAKYYFTGNLKIYSDKTSNFVYKCNEKTNGEVINRISRIYPFIFIDEVQDLAGWDLELLKLLFKSNSQIIMVGDPRQAVYDTNDSPKYQNYRGGGIVNFINDRCKKDNCIIETKLLNESHRNNSIICKVSSKLYPNFTESVACKCKDCKVDTEHEGIFVIKKSDVDTYINTYKPQVLRYRESEFPDLNFGASKGLTFDRVIIYPTQTIIKYLVDGKLKKQVTKKNKLVEKDAFDIAKFYVALTRARHSVAIVYDYDPNEKFIDNIQTYKLN